MMLQMCFWCLERMVSETVRLIFDAMTIVAESLTENEET